VPEFANDGRGSGTETSSGDYSQSASGNDGSYASNTGYGNTTTGDTVGQGRNNDSYDSNNRKDDRSGSGTQVSSGDFSQSAPASDGSYGSTGYPGNMTDGNTAGQSFGRDSGDSGSYGSSNSGVQVSSGDFSQSAPANDGSYATNTGYGNTTSGNTVGQGRTDDSYNSNSNFDADRSSNTGPKVSSGDFSQSAPASDGSYGSTGYPGDTTANSGAGGAYGKESNNDSYGSSNNDSYGSSNNDSYGSSDNTRNTGGQPGIASTMQGKSFASTISLSLG
jgi:hypothetical protein